MKRTLFPALATLSILVLSSCIGNGPVRDAVRRYLPAPPSAPVEVIAGAPSVGLREVTLPGYLDSSRIALRLSPGEIAYSDFNLWAQPLGKAVAGTVGRQMRARIGADRVDVYPWTAGVPHEVEVRLQFDSFEGDSSGAVKASGRCVLSGAARTIVIPFEYAEKWDGKNYASLASALGEILDRIAADILAKAGGV